MGLLMVPLIIFAVGFMIGMAAFSNSKAQVVYAFFCGIAALVVTVAVVFAGCAMMMSGSHF